MLPSDRCDAFVGDLAGESEYLFAVRVLVVGHAGVVWGRQAITEVLGEVFRGSGVDGGGIAQVTRDGHGFRVTGVSLELE